MANFHETNYGRIFLEHQLPSLIKNLGRIADVLEKKTEEKADLNITEETSSSTIWGHLSDTQKEALYRMGRYDHVYEDVKTWLSEHPFLRSNIDEREEICAQVANAFVYDGEYDPSLPYWKNIDHLINKLL